VIDVDLRRTVSKFKADPSKGNFSETGIKYNSKLNEMPNYHVVDNCLVDIMHDILEGVAKIGVVSVICPYINEGIFIELSYKSIYS